MIVGLPMLACKSSFFLQYNVFLYIISYWPLYIVIVLNWFKISIQINTVHFRLSWPEKLPELVNLKKKKVQWKKLSRGSRLSKKIYRKIPFKVCLICHTPAIISLLYWQVCLRLFIFRVWLVLADSPYFFYCIIIVYWCYYWQTASKWLWRLQFSFVCYWIFL